MQKFFTILGLIGIGIVGRLLPHLPNVTPVTAITLTARKQLGVTWAFIVPTATMLLSDAVIGFYDWKILISVYLSFCLIAWMSLFLQQTSRSRNTILLAVAGSIIFFLITNFAVWLFSPWYEKSISGLIYCYTLGLPFLRNMILGDIVYTSALVATFKLMQVKIPIRYFLKRKTA